MVLLTSESSPKFRSELLALMLSLLMFNGGAPNGRVQVKLLRKTLIDAVLTGRDVDYLEALFSMIQLSCLLLQT